MSSIFQLTKGAERKFAPVFKILSNNNTGFLCGNKGWKEILKPYLVLKKGNISLVFAVVTYSNNKKADF